MKHVTQTATPDITYVTPDDFDLPQASTLQDVMHELTIH